MQLSNKQLCVILTGITGSEWESDYSSLMMNGDFTKSKLHNWKLKIVRLLNNLGIKNRLIAISNINGNNTLIIIKVKPPTNQ